MLLPFENLIMTIIATSRLNEAGKWAMAAILAVSEAVRRISLTHHADYLPSTYVTKTRCGHCRRAHDLKNCVAFHNRKGNALIHQRWTCMSQARKNFDWKSLFNQGRQPAISIRVNLRSVHWYISLCLWRSLQVLEWNDNTLLSTYICC